MGVSGVGDSSVGEVTNSEVPQHLSKEVVEGGRDDAREGLGKGEDSCSLLYQSDHPGAGRNIGNPDVSKALQRSEDELGNSLVLLKPGGHCQLLQVHHVGVHWQHHGEGSNSQLPVLALVEDDGRVYGKEGLPVLVGHLCQGVDSHLPVTNVACDLALNVGEENGEDSVMANGSKGQDSSMHLMIVGGCQFGLQVRDVIGDDLGEVWAAHLAKHVHWEDCLGLVLVETGPVQNGCKRDVGVVLQHLVGDNVGVLDQLKDVLDDVHVGNLDVLGQGHQHLSRLDNVELVGHDHFLEEHDSRVGACHLDSVGEQSPLHGLVLHQLKDGLDLLQLVHSNHVLERLQNGSRLFSSKVLNILESLCDVSELLHNHVPDGWCHWHKFAIWSEHMVGGVHSQALEVILLLLEAGDLHPLLTRDGLGVFKEEVLHNSRCNDGWQGGLSRSHLLQRQNLPGASHHLLSVESQQVLLVLSFVDDGVQLEVCHVRSTTKEAGHPNPSVDSVASSDQTVLVASRGNEEAPLGTLGDVPGPHQLEDLLSLAHVRLDQCSLSLADEVGRDLSDLVHVLTGTVNALIHHGPEGGEVAMGHWVVTWDGVGKLGDSWQLNLDGSNQGFLEVDAPFGLVSRESDLLDLPGLHLSLDRGLEERPESLGDWSSGGCHHCPPVQGLRTSQLLIEVVELDVPQGDLEDTVAETLGGEAMALQKHLAINCHSSKGILHLRDAGEDLALVVVDILLPSPHQEVGGACADGTEKEQGCPHPHPLSLVRAGKLLSPC